MKLREFPLKRSYTSGLDNPLEEFLIPILKLTNRFYYISGFFSSRLISLLSYGIKNFIVNNNGKIKLIAGFVFPSDINILNLSDKELESNFIEIINDDFFSKEFEKDQRKIEHLKLFAWLLYNKRIEIKWGLIYNPFVKFFVNEGILHEKIGILQDKDKKDNDYIVFSGSANATYYAWIKNREELKVFKSWEENSKEYANDDFNKFFNYWEDEDPILKLFNFPIKFRDEIVKKYLPSTNDINEIDFDFIDENVRKELQKELWWKVKSEQLERDDWKYQTYTSIRLIENIEPRNYQEDALEFLKLNDYVGFLQMATGSGKTKIAIIASYILYQELIEKRKKLLIIISVPDSYLVDQWYNELKDYSKNVVKCYSQNPNWKNLLSNQLNRLFFNASDHCYVIGTHESLNSENWESKIIKPCKNALHSLKILFIGDEAHTLGAPTRLLTIEHITPFLRNHYRIGLSATPIREFDEEGTQSVLNFFKREASHQNVHPFLLKDAQENDLLMKFDYFPIRCEFEHESFNDFIKLTKKIGKKMNIFKEITKNKKEHSVDLTRLLNQRADLLKKSTTKLFPLRDLLLYLHENKKLSKTVIYTKDREQRTAVINMITQVNSDFELKNKISLHTIDGSDINPIRIERINDLTRDKINLLIVMKCLDQGVDIPSLERAIFLSSSGTELEHIQRAGRLLRKHENKEGPVEIYDFFVFPNEGQIINDKEISKNIFSIEQRRIKFFMEIANNKSEIEDLIWELRAEFF